VFSDDQDSDAVAKKEEEINHEAKVLQQATMNSTKKKLDKLVEALKGNYDLDIKQIKIVPANEDVREEVLKIQNDIRYLYLATTKEIEETGTANLKLDKDTLFSISHGERQERIANNQEQINVTISSQAMAIKVLVRLNDSLIEMAKNETNRKKKQQLYMTQAMYVYELSHIVLNMIDNISMSGIEDLRALHKETMQTFKEMETVFNEMIKENEDEEAKNWLKALDFLRVQWGTVLGTLDNQEGWLNNLKEEKDKFEDIAKKAVFQLQLLEQGVIMDIVINQIAAVKSVLEEELPILRLGQNEMESLLTLMPPEDINTSTRIKTHIQ